MPTDRLTIRSTIFDSSEKENTAAAEMLITPEMVVASKMEVSVESILSLGKYATKLQIKAQTGYFGKRCTSRLLRIRGAAFRTGQKLTALAPPEKARAGDQRMGQGTVPVGPYATPCPLNHARQRRQPSLASAST